ncbi:MAG: hypothetical protein JWO10_1082, partial [Microbacteriaceae bacterium]|nr:hypothetical protein [Microbacteriaceae bacterium]
MSDFQQKVIDEFRANDGKVGGRFEGLDLLLMTTTGAKSGEKRVNPAQAFSHDGVLHVVAAKHAHPNNPAWYHNLVAHPEVEIEHGTGEGLEKFSAIAEVLGKAERDVLFAQFCLIN